MSAEIPNFDLQRALNNGMLPRHYLSANATERLQAYIGDLLRQEIVEEAIVRRIDIFTRFLQVAALTNTEIVNYTNIAHYCGISAKTVKEYFSILEETMLGFMLPAYRKVVKRQVKQSPKFYFFDVAIANHLLHRVPLQHGTDVYGHAVEHLVIQELRAYLAYTYNGQKQLAYWHTQDNLYEVDAIVGDAEVAIEVKASSHIILKDTKGLRAFGEEYPNAKLIILSMEERPRMIGNVEMWPVAQFLSRLWHGLVV